MALREFTHCISRIRNGIGHSARRSRGVDEVRKLINTVLRRNIRVEDGADQLDETLDGVDRSPGTASSDAIAVTSDNTIKEATTRAGTRSRHRGATVP
jgi:hypothetical protein